MTPKTAADRAREMIAENLGTPSAPEIYKAFTSALTEIFEEQAKYENEAFAKAIASQRIAELEKQVTELEARLQTERDTRNIVLNGRNDTVADLSAKLAVAVEALKLVAIYSGDPGIVRGARSALAAIEGQSAKGEKE